MARTTVQETFTLFLALNIRTYTKFESQNTPYIGGGAGGAGGSVAPTPLPPPKKTNNKQILGGRTPLPRFWCRKTLVRRYLTLPVTWPTSKDKFSALRRLTNYLRSTMTQDRLKTVCCCIVTDRNTATLDTVKIAK